MDKKEIQSRIEAEIEKRNCLGKVPAMLIETCSVCYARWSECEEKNNKLGLLAKHPASGQPIPSPFVQMALMYLREGNDEWNKICAIMKENHATPLDARELLLLIGDKEKKNDKKD